MGRKYAILFTHLFLKSHRAAHFFIGLCFILLSCKSSFYVFYQIHVCKCFQSVAYLFIFLTVSLKEQKFNILMKSNLLIYFFIFTLSVPHLRSPCLIENHKDFLLKLLQLDLWYNLTFIYYECKYWGSCLSM